MRYPPESGTWGSGTRDVEIFDEHYYTGRWSVSNNTGRRNFGFYLLDTLGVNLGPVDIIDDTNYSLVMDGMVQDEIGNFAESMSLSSYQAAYQCYGVIFFDSTGIKRTVIDTSQYSYIYIKSMVRSMNGELYLVGDIQEVTGNPNNGKLVLIKTDSLGHQLWKKTFNMSNFKAWSGESISLCDDGGFIIGGAENEYIGNTSFTRPIIMKVDSNGNRIWHRKLGSTTYDNKPAYGVTQTPNGYAMVGAIGLEHWGGIAGGGYSPWVVGLNDNGGVVWMDTLDAAYAVRSNYYRDIELIQDSNLIVTGNYDIHNDTNSGTDKWRPHGVIAKFSVNGERKWVRSYRHPEVKDHPLSDHYLFDIDPTPDGGFVAAGYLLHSIDNTQDTWMIKVDSFGCLVKGCEVTSVPKIESSVAQVKIYPNPASEVIHFDITPNNSNSPHYGSAQRSGLTYKLELYDMLGRLVLKQSLQPFENEIDVSKLKTGVYNYRLNETWGSIVVD